jgi:hypothetical protein
MARQYHYWIISRDETGRPYVIYGAPDFGSNGGEDVARTKAFELLGGMDFELKRLATRNLDAARAFVAGGRLEKGMGLKESTRRQGHEKSLARLRKRRLERGI